jgi:hypothetical protein
VRRELAINSGPRTLSRLYCDTCKEETLHNRGVCNHCAAQAERSASPGGTDGRTRPLKTTGSWRADHDAMCKARMNARDTAASMKGS